MASGWRIEVTRERCMSTGACAFSAPEVFALDEDGISTVIGEVDGTSERVRNAVEECPAAALRLLPAG
jgi:ferredoxin